MSKINTIWKRNTCLWQTRASNNIINYSNIIYSNKFIYIIYTKLPLLVSLDESCRNFANFIIRCLLVMASEHLSSHRDAADEAEDTEFRFLAGRCFCRVSRAHRASEGDEEDRPPTATILLFFFTRRLSLTKGGSRDGYMGAKKRRRDVRVDDSLSSTFLRLYLYRVLLFFFSSSPFIRFVVFTRPDKV